jgi:predicted nucleic acid-binding protein
LNAYVDASVVLRVVFGEAGSMAGWTSIERAVSSELVRTECLRAIDRRCVRALMNERDLSRRRAVMLETLDAIEIVPLGPEVLERAGDPFPTSLGTLDAIHLASALAIRDDVPDLVFATHDAALGLAASAMGFDVQGVDL